MSNQEIDLKRLITSSHRIQWARLGGHTRKLKSGGEKFAYEVTLLIPKGHPDVARIQAAERAAFNEKAATDFKGIPFESDRIKKKLTDGDKYMADGRQEQTYLAGHWFLSLSSNDPVPMFDIGGIDCIDPNVLYSGCIARADIKAWAYNNEGMGITFFINSIRKTADGDRFVAANDAQASDYDNDADYGVPQIAAPTGYIAPPVGVPPVAAAPLPPPPAALPTPPAAFAPPVASPAPPVVAPPVQQPEPIWNKAADGRDIYSLDGGVTWAYYTG